MTGSPDTAEAHPARRPRRGRRLGVVALFSLIVPVAAVALLVFAISGTPWEMPDWARARVETLLSAQLQSFDVSIDGVALVIEDDWDPSIELRGVQVLPPDGGPISLSLVTARLAFAPLLDRQVAFRDVRVSGVTLTVLRQADGSTRIALGQAADSGGLQTDTDATRFGDQIESYLEAPVLAQLDAFRVEDVTIRFEDLRERRAWTVDGGQITLMRDGDRVDVSAQMTLLAGRSYASTIEASLTTRFGTSETEFGFSFEDLPSEDIASQIVALSWLEIMRAPISGALRANIDADGNLGNVNATLQVSDGMLQPGGEVRPVPFQEMRSYLTYDPERRAIRFDELSIDSDLMRVSAFGEAFMRDFEQGVPGEFLVQLTLNEFRANPRNLDDDPIRLERSFADFRLRLDPFSLDLGQLVVRQADNQIVLNGHLETDQANWNYAVNGHLDAVEPDDVLAVWPRSFKHKLRKWIVENVHKAHVHDVDLAIRSRGADVPDVYVDFQFADTAVRAVKTMPPIIDGSGFGVFQDSQLHLAVEEAFVEAEEGGLIDVSGASFVILNTRLKQSPALVRAKAVGSITAVLSLLDREPLRLLSKANLPVDFAPGRAELEGTVELVLKDNLPIEEVHYDVRGDLRDVVSDHFLPGKEMRGEFTVHARPERVDVEGAGFLEELPVTAHWHMLGGKENAGNSWLNGTAELSETALDVFEVGLPDGTVQERGEIAYDLAIAKDVPPVLELRSDLVGVRLSAPPLGWNKQPETPGTLEIDMTLGPRAEIDRVVLKTPGLSAEGRVTLAENGGLGVAQLDSFAVGSWARGQGELRGRGFSVPPAVVVTSGRLDMRAMPSASRGGSGGDMGPVSATVDEVIVTDTIRLAPATAELTSQNGRLSGTFSGNFNGVPFVQGTFSPHTHGSRIQVQSDQGGQVAVQMGFVDAATKGRMTLDLVPREQAGQYDGTLSMKELKVQDVPVIAELLNAISVVGLIEQLSGPGLLFTDVYSKFRLTPERLIIGEGSAAGPSIGLSVNGTYSFVQSWFDLQGTISPLYAVNVLGRPFSRRGEGLIGFNYRMQGPSSQPKVSVNPLSALTPGFFREIFRRQPPDLSN
ncbi:hypothetical protein [Shimia sp.]|uniref:hypothetical protein n=1 Tax=Shimia sp. TaxID=1954381 RepID=UPI003B8CB7BF